MAQGGTKDSGLTQKSDPTGLRLRGLDEVTPESVTVAAVLVIGMSGQIWNWLNNHSYDSTGLKLQSADIDWPDGATGTLTVDTFNDTWFEIDKWTATYDDGVNAPVSLVFEVTGRNSVGEPTGQTFNLS